MFRLFKNFYVHYSVLLLFLCFVLGSDYNTPGLILLSVILHECGHLVVLLFCGGKPEKIVFHAFGVSINTNVYKLSSDKMLLTAMGGPALSFLLAGLFYFVYPPLFSPNLCIGLVNLLPILPLDGGRILGNMLAKVLGRKGSRTVMRYLGMCFCTLAIPTGLLLFAYSGFNTSLIILGFFIAAESFNTPFSEPACFVMKKPTLGEIYLIPQNTGLRETADMLPAGGIGAIVDENGAVLRLVTARGLYNELAKTEKLLY